MLGDFATVTCLILIQHSARERPSHIAPARPFSNTISHCYNVPSARSPFATVLMYSQAILINGVCKFFGCKPAAIGTGKLLKLRFLGCDTDSGIFAYFRRHHAELFPELLEVCRTTFTRQAANLWKIKEHLHAGGMDNHGEDQSHRVDHKVAFSPVYALTSIIPSDPPFSVVLTDWLSMMPALGCTLRLALLRTCWSNVV